MDTEAFGNGEYQGNNHDKRGEYVHEAADSQKEDIEDEQIQVATVNSGLNELEQFHGDLLIDHEVGESCGAGQNDENDADHFHAFDTNGNEFGKGGFPGNDRFGYQHVKNSHSRYFNQGEKAAVNAGENQKGKRNVPFSFFNRFQKRSFFRLVVV